jgi:hypothetical protein
MAQTTIAERNLPHAYTSNIALPVANPNDNSENAATTRFVRDWIGSVHPGWDRANWFTFFEEFLNSTNSGGNFTTGVSGTGAVLSAIAAEPNHPGIVSVSTGTTATGRAGFGSNALCLRLGGGSLIYEALINIPTLSTSAERYIIRVGLMDTFTADAVDGVYFEYDEATSANWKICAANNSTRTKTITSVAVTSGWTKLYLELNAAGTNATYYANGTSLGSVTTNIPTASGRETSIGAWIIKSAGTTARTFWVDYILLRQAFTTAR